MRSVSVPSQLIERRARLQWRDRVDQIGDGLGLHEIDSAVEKCAKRELAGLRKPRPKSHRLLDDLPKHDRASVRADLDDVFAGVGMGSGEVGRDNLIVVRARERRVTWLKWCVELQQSAPRQQRPTAR